MESAVQHMFLVRLVFVGFDHFDDSLGFNRKIENCAMYKVVLACWPEDFICIFNYDQIRNIHVYILTPRIHETNLI